MWYIRSIILYNMKYLVALMNENDDKKYSSIVYLAFETTFFCKGQCAVKEVARLVVQRQRHKELPPSKTEAHKRIDKPTLHIIALNRPSLLQRWRRIRSG